MQSELTQIINAQANALAAYVVRCDSLAAAETGSRGLPSDGSSDGILRGFSFAGLHGGLQIVRGTAKRNGVLSWTVREMSA